MKIIDFDKKGNLVRFYLGEKTKSWGWTNSGYRDYIDDDTPILPAKSNTYFGDDWDDAPYEHNAGKVYDEFIKGHKDITFDFDDLVLEPADGCCNSNYSKEDMRERRVPCIIVVPAKLAETSLNTSFEYWLGSTEIKKYYFGDEL